MDERKPVLCVFCRQPVRTTHVYGYGTQWIHFNGFYECRPTYAAPDLITWERENKEG